MNRLKLTMAEIIKEAVKLEGDEERRTRKADEVRRSIDPDFNEREQTRSND